MNASAISGADLPVSSDNSRTFCFKSSRSSPEAPVNADNYLIETSNSSLAFAEPTNIAAKPPIAPTAKPTGDNSVALSAAPKPEIPPVIPLTEDYKPMRAVTIPVIEPVFIAPIKLPIFPVKPIILLLKSFIAFFDFS